MLIHADDRIHHAHLTPRFRFSSSSYGFIEDDSETLCLGDAETLWHLMQILSLQ